MDLVIDIGGTKTRLAAVRNGELTAPHVFPTPSDTREAARAIAGAARKLAGEKYDRIIAAVPGILSADRLSLVWSPNLATWVNQPLAALLAADIGAPISLLNDADAAGLGEASFGAGQDHHIVAYLTISTGIGGSRIVGGQIDAAASGFEPGHQIIDADGTLVPGTPQPTSLEHLIGGASTKQRYKKHPRDIIDTAVWASYARYLAIGLNNVIALWSPHVIVLGGPMMRDIKRDLVARHVRELMPGGTTPPPIVPAALADDTRALQGGLAFLEQH